MDMTHTKGVSAADNRTHIKITLGILDRYFQARATLVEFAYDIFVIPALKLVSDVSCVFRASIVAYIAIL